MSAFAITLHLHSFVAKCIIIDLLATGVNKELKLQFFQDDTVNLICIFQNIFAILKVDKFYFFLVGVGEINQLHFIFKEQFHKNTRLIFAQSLRTMPASVT